MNDECFKTLLEQAISGNREAIEGILLLYEPLIINNSIVNGKFDEDLKQYISLHIIKNISKFKITK